MPRRDRPPGAVELLEVGQVILARGARDARAQEAAVAPLTAVAPGGAGGDASLECEFLYPSDSFSPNISGIGTGVARRVIPRFQLACNILATLE